MAKAKMKQAVVPNFSSEAEETAWWDAHRSEIEAEIRQRIKQKRPLTLGNLIRAAKPSQPVTLRIRKEDLETARRLAARLGLGYQTYIKMLLRGALAKNASEEISDGDGRTRKRRLEFDAHKVVKGTEVEFKTRNDARGDFIAHRPARIPDVRFKANSNRKISSKVRGRKS